MNMILFESLPENLFIPIADERANHIISILELKEGDTFKMGIFNESEGLAKVEKITEEGISFSYEAKEKPSLYPVTLLVAQVRPICMKRILREAVSLGVSKIVLTGSETGEKSYLQSNLYKTGEYKEYLLDGAMQSCHAGLPEVCFAENVRQAIGFAQDNEASLIMLDNVTGAIPLSCATINSHAVLAIGPERGWTDNERKQFENAGYKPMLLGSRVLRTETACSAGLAVLLSRMGLL